MLAVFGVSVRRAVWRGARLHPRRVPAAGCAGSAPGSGAAAGRGLSRQLISRHGTAIRGCTVDPNLEEQFVFVDCTDPDPDPDPDPHQEEKDLLQLSHSSSSPPAAPPPGSLADQFPPQRHLRSLERQLQVLKGVAQKEAEPDSLIQFHDVDFPLDDGLVAAKTTKKKKKTAGKGEHKVFGTPDLDEPVSDSCCSGCGAILHCTAADVPGYLPSEKFKALREEERLSGATCQRCHLLTHHHKALSLTMSADQYRAVVRQVRPHKALVLLIVDLLDVPDSIVADLPELVGTNKHVVVLGNKIDLLPGDSPNYLQRIKRQLAQYCRDAGFGGQVTDVHLISAKTGYGIEGLITSLQRSWRYKGDVYLVGSANAGKSTLFNTLLESDYCKSKGSDVIHKATISPWPGTTLNLLKFPIINPTPYRMFRRQERLNEAARQTESELSQDELKRLKHFSRQGYLVGRVGRTFRSDIRSKSKEIDFDPDSLAFGENEDGDMTTTAPSRPTDEFTFNELKDAHWLFDTPGIMKEHDILSLLTEEEVMSVVPTQAVVPRTFVLKPGLSLFLGALARIDFLQGGKSCWFSVVASSRVPVHVTSLEKAASVYEKHAGHVLLGVPLGGSERMKEFPALVPQEFRLEGRGYLEAAADIKLSSAGWVAVTAAEGDQLLLRVHGPEAAGFSLRTPPLLPHVVSLKGERIRKSAAYKLVKPPGLLDSGLSAHGAERLQVKKKKKR
ncbi:nitric oxide-associated protein 1 isoform X4 [Micropterus salmoides]|uniref:nitric oxide-associated protein 1 isoform X3 n=1 Tax=Micropterus salmoides TaxID=27706 RepID=UPI0018ED0B84|nr:nitric oxide-associated protein 1 isoform X3 [Micropterus salmoides]XP_038554785.1 nitric oxide-associated protein 1 isoform X4 [Micropterus salmoides]